MIVAKSVTRGLLLLFLTIIALYAKACAAKGPATGTNHPSVRAAMNCIGQLRPIVKNRQKHGPDVICSIPITLVERNLDEIFKAAMRSTRMSDKNRQTAQKYTSLIAKTLTNFRAADCRVKLHLKRTDILEALSGKTTTLQMTQQPADCNVTTKKYKTQKLTFSFAPRIDMKQGCVEKFALNMGHIDAGCKICYFNRLYLSTRLVSVWANRMGDNVKRALNIQLGPTCR